MAIADPHPLRKCAILVSSVDADAARQMLMQLPTETAQQVRRLAARLDDVEPAERQAIIQEFRQAAVAGGLAAAAYAEARKPMAASSPVASPKVDQAPLPSQEVPTETSSESPWQAAQAGQFPAATAADPVVELTDEQADVPDAPDSADSDDVPAVSIHTQAEQERSASGRVRDLDDLLALPRELLSQVMNGCDSQTVLLALAGASPQFIERFYGMLQPSDAQDLDRRLKSIGGLKLSDIDQAQIRLVEAAEQLMRGRRKSA